MFSSELLIQTFIAGLMIGVLYALMALGITFIYSSHRRALPVPS
jgi:branched-chain amino acid transport system permease protein